MEAKRKQKGQKGKRSKKEIFAPFAFLSFLLPLTHFNSRLIEISEFERREL